MTVRLMRMKTQIQKNEKSVDGFSELQLVKPCELRFQAVNVLDTACTLVVLTLLYFTVGFGQDQVCA